MCKSLYTSDNLTKSMQRVRKQGGMTVSELANMKYGGNVVAQLQTNNNTFLITSSVME